MVTRYVPTIGLPDWNIKELDKEARMKLKERLVLCQTSDEQEYRRVIAYLYTKFPHEMDLTKLPDGSANVPIQWRYSAGKNQAKVYNIITGKDQSMYAFIIYDKERDMEPVAFAGSYFTFGEVYHGADDEINVSFRRNARGEFNAFGDNQFYGNGIVMFVDPAYRRMGLATDLWWAEGILYTEALGIRFQKEIQNEYSLVSTQKMFSDPAKCIVTSWGRVKNDGTHSQIRCLLDYTDEDIRNGFDSMLPNLQTIYKECDWRFMEREAVNGVTAERLDQIFENGKL